MRIPLAVRLLSLACLVFVGAGTSGRGRESQDYRNSVLPPGVPRIAVEAAAPQSWYRWTGESGVIMGIERFGESAPYQRIYKEFGLTVDGVVAEALRHI